MKKVLGLSFLLFATTMSFSATGGRKVEGIQKRLDIIFPSTIQDMPVPVLGCKRPPPCPTAPAPKTYF
jgi:hypothetical protein